MAICQSLDGAIVGAALSAWDVSNRVDLIICRKGTKLGHLTPDWNNQNAS